MRESAEFARRVSGPAYPLLFPRRLAGFWRARFQYGLLHFGQTTGRLDIRGAQMCSHLSQENPHMRTLPIHMHYYITRTISFIYHYCVYTMRLGLASVPWPP